MDYKTAEKHFTKRSPLRRRLDKMNSTWLHRASTAKGERIHVRLYRTNIITFFSDDSFSINTGGYITPATKDRFRRYLPKGCNVWFEYLADKSFIATLRTPRGSRPCTNHHRFTRDFRGTCLDEMNDQDACTVRKQVRDYVRAYIQRLVSTGLPAPYRLGDCVRCLRANRESSHEDNPCFDEGHYLEHLNRMTMPASLLWSALHQLPHDFDSLWRSANALFGPSRCLLRQARTRNERLQRAEADLMGLVAIDRDPRKDRRALRDALEMFLLERVGFERIEPKFVERDMHKGETVEQLMGW